MTPLIALCLMVLAILASTVGVEWLEKRGRTGPKFTTKHLRRDP
jgi:hypothetical protein